MNFFRYSSIEDVIEQLIDEGYLEPEDIDAVTHVLATSPEPESPAPWFVQVLIGLGAWLAAVFCLLSFAIVMGSSIQPAGAIFFGLMLSLMALAVKYSQPSDFLRGQFALVLALMGQIQAIVGFGGATESVTATLWATIILEAILLVAYPGLVQRFISAALIIGALYWLILLGPLTWALHLLATVLAALTVALWVRAPFLGDSTTQRGINQTLSYALPTGMFGGLLLPVLELHLRWVAGSEWTTANFDKPLIASAGLFILALWLIQEILERYHLAGRDRLVRLLGGGTFLIAVATVQTPGILAALLVLTIGFWRNDTVLMGLALAFMTTFIGVFYYNLQTTLLVKSYILLTTGGMLVGLWYLVFQRRQVIKEK